MLLRSSFIINVPTGNLESVLKKRLFQVFISTIDVQVQFSLHFHFGKGVKLLVWAQTSYVCIITFRMLVDLHFTLL